MALSESTHDTSSHYVTQNFQFHPVTGSRIAKKHGTARAMSFLTIWAVFDDVDVFILKR